MKKWKKVSLLTLVLTGLVLVSLYLLLDAYLVVPGGNVTYAPSGQSAKTTGKLHGERPENIILFIADGFGFGHLSLAMKSEKLRYEPDPWSEFDIHTWHDTGSAQGPSTDSEASATAMATGTPTNYGHIGIDPQGNQLQNVFELASNHGFLTGIVTDSYIWDGTPAAFVAHTRNEDDARDILEQIAASSLDILIGELEDVGEDDIPEEDETYEILEQRFRILDASEILANLDNYDQPVASVYQEDQVQDLNSEANLPELLAAVLDYVSGREDPFFLFVESEEMDAGSHENDDVRISNGLQSISTTLSLLREFCEDHPSTLLVFTSDHETGGLSLVPSFDDFPNMQMRWTTKDHTTSPVPLFAVGPGAEHFKDVRFNWQIGQVLKALVVKDSTGSN